MQVYRRNHSWSARYNCIAWAAGADQEWWWPTSGYYWPCPLPIQATVGAATAAFETLGYAVCDDGQLEPGFEKLAIFAIDQRLTHAARQLPDGRWTSKLGKRIDIAHDTLQSLEGEAYGRVACYLKRATKPA